MDTSTPSFFYKGSINTVIGKKSYAAITCFDYNYCYDLFDNFFIDNPTTLDKLKGCSEVWIKPNITSPEPPTQGRTTSPEVLETLIQLVKKYINTTTNIIISDSSVIGCNTFESAEIAGIIGVCVKNTVKFVDVRMQEFKNIFIDEKTNFQIALPFLKKDTFKINLAKIKSTYGCPASFSIKNAKGIIHDSDKILFHNRGVQKSIAELYKIINWDVSVLEGDPMSELGVSAERGPIIISEDCLITDLLACLLVHMPVDEITYLKNLSEMLHVDYNGLRNEKMIVDNHQTYAPLIYAKSGLDSLEDRYKVTIIGSNPCSGCLESLAKSFYHLDKKGIKCDGMQIFLGNSYDNTLLSKVSNKKMTFCIGNCSFVQVYHALCEDSSMDIIEKCYRNSKKVKGCPPTIDQITECLKTCNQKNTKQNN